MGAEHDVGRLTEEDDGETGRTLFRRRDDSKAMDESHRWSLRAAFGFALILFGVAFAWAVVSLYVTSTETLRDGLNAADLAVFEPVLIGAVGGVAAVGGALVGGPAWAVVVERWDRWSITRRGALAGACTGFFAVPVAAALVAPAFEAPADPTVPEAVVGGFVIGLIGLVVVGWTTIPAGAATGYALALWRADDATPVWSGLFERLR